MEAEPEGGAPSLPAGVGLDQALPLLCPPGKPLVYKQGTHVGWASPPGQALASLPSHWCPSLCRPHQPLLRQGPDLEGLHRPSGSSLGTDAWRPRVFWAGPGCRGAGDCPLRCCLQNRGPGSLWPHSALKWVKGIGFSGPVDQQGAMKKAQRAERMQAGGVPCSTKSSGHQAILSVLRARGILGCSRAGDA